jgi:subtilisin
MTESNGFDQPDGSNNYDNNGGGHRPGYTGRFLVSFEPGTWDQAGDLLRNQAGIQALSAKDTGSQPGTASMVFEEIGVAVVSADPSQHQALVAAVADRNVPVSHLEAERIVYAISQGAAYGNGVSKVNKPAPRRLDLPESPSAGTSVPSSAFNTEFLRGFTAAVEALLSATQGTNALRFEAESDVAQTSALATWGIRATRVTESERSGRGIKVAVLDTGMDLHHPDFAGRTVVSRSFVAGVNSAQDGHGHGTHCVGVACGPRQPPIGPRYGVAYGADIYVGKVLSDAGSGTDGEILAGINWAVANRCAIVSMSLGSPVGEGETYSRAYQDAARAAESKGTLIVAAAGNESERPGFIAPVGHPANCPTILAVGALDAALKAAWFSCGGINGNGGEVNIAAPGVGVYSSVPMPKRYETMNGTSMATPCAAGILALFAEATGLRGLALANDVLRRTRRLSPVRDFGWGLVQAV